MKLSNLDRTDLEMLHIIRKACNGDLFVSGEDIAAELGIVSDGTRTGAGRVGPRLSWMARFGMLHKTKPSDLGREGKGVLWGITDAGERLMSGKLSTATENAIERDDPGAQLLIMRRLTQRAIVHGDEATAVALRREFEHNRAQR